MRIFRFSVAGTNYRALLQELTAEQARACGVSEPGVFFSFGVGDRPVAGYFFHAGDTVGWHYFCEKLAGVSDSPVSREHTLGVAYYTFTQLVAGEIATRGGAPLFETLGIEPFGWAQLLKEAEIRWGRRNPCQNW